MEIRATQAKTPPQFASILPFGRAGRKTQEGSMFRRVELFLACAAAGALAAGAAVAQSAGAGAPLAVYTADQASQGAAVYQQQCAACHGSSLEGVAGPALKGPQFKAMAQAQALNAQSLLLVVSQSMPQSDPGSLTPEQYGQVVAYILQQNGYPAGSTPLSAQAANLKDLDLSK
jgi:mono/diheme cytochrome c family protein